jgi:hypothetical protein
VTLFSVPPVDEDPWPSLGGAVCDLIEERAVFGPGSLKGEPAVLDDEKRLIIWRAYEVFPKGHPLEGRRRWRRVAVSLPKGSAKTEILGWIAFAELHPDGPVRFDGWDASGQPVGRPVRDPYIPLVGVTEEATEELAYGVLYVVCSEGEDADLFDIGLDRILRLGPNGKRDGIAAALAAAPNARDGARTTFQGFDETHRLVLPNYLKAHQTMLANLTKRPLDDPWHMEVTTAGELGQGSIGEKTHREAEGIAAGTYTDPDLLYHHREADEKFVVVDEKGKVAPIEIRVAAVADARAGVGEYAPGQFREIAKQWERPGADLAYLARVWLNRWGKGQHQAFNPLLWQAGRAASEEAGLALRPEELVVVGFDGSRFRDSTAIVVCDVETGVIDLAAVWERPLDVPAGTEWEVPEGEVVQAMARVFDTYQVWKAYCDPPYWTEVVGAWAARWPDQVEEWWTNRFAAVGHANREFAEALADKTMRPGNGPLADTLERHVAAAGREPLQMWLPDGTQLYRLGKQHPDRKIDATVAAVLAWQARLEAIRQGAKKKRRSAPQRWR